MNTQEKFDLLRSYQLPLGHYAITGSGPLGIRNLREIGDIDILATDALWKELEAKYGATEEEGEIKVVFPDGLISAYRQGSFAPFHSDAFRIRTHRHCRDHRGFPALDYVLTFKRLWGAKDLEDIRLIEEWRLKA